jgi:hypothetical protein
MANAYGIALDDRSRRWAATERVPESVIAAICLLEHRGVDQIVAKLSPAELEQVISIVGRSPSCYPPGVYAALKGRRGLASPQPQTPLTPIVTVREHPRPAQSAATPLQDSARRQNGANPEVVVATAPAARSAAAERMRQHRGRRRQGLRCLMIELHVTEIDSLVSLGLLKAEMRDDPGEVSVALYEHLNRTLGAMP